MINHESKSALLFRAWWRANRIAGAFELKDSRGKSSIPFSEVTQDQIDSGMANKSRKGNLIRIASGTTGTADYISLVGYPSYIVIKFPAGFEIIDVETFDLERNRSKLRQLSHIRAKQISIISIKLSTR